MHPLAEFDKDMLGAKSCLVGVDEAGRGAFAGPVVAAAMAVSAKLYQDETLLKSLEKLDDSKKLDAKTRDKFFDMFVSLKKNGLIDFEAAHANIEEIETLNIVGATKLAMSRALKILNERAKLFMASSSMPASLFGEGGRDLAKAEVIIDGLKFKNFPYRHLGIVKGDGKSLAIAAASIIAKVTRDRIMKDLAASYPHYAFEIHKGYGTPAHSQSILVYGSCPAHRPSFLKKLRAEDKPQIQDELF